MITFFRPQLTHPIETMAYFLSMAGHRVRVATNFGISDGEHPWSLKRLERFGEIDILPYDGEARVSEVLIFSLVQHGQIAHELRRWRRMAKKTFCLASREGHSFSLRERARQVVRSFPHYLGARQIAPLPHVHPQFIANTELRDLLQRPFDQHAKRKYKVCFLGSLTPPERATRLRQIESVVTSLGAKSYWHVYGETGVRGIDPASYLEVLTDSEFTISPPGWGGGYTHRTYEAVLRGSIPIIEDPERYDIPFKDGINCLIANPTQWDEATSRAIALPAEQLFALQIGVADIRKLLELTVQVESCQRLINKGS